MEKQLIEYMDQVDHLEALAFIENTSKNGQYINRNHFVHLVKCHALNGREFEHFPVVLTKLSETMFSQDKKLKF